MTTALEANREARPGCGLSDANWNMLLKRIAAGNCTPFLGAEVYSGTLPSASDIARQWASNPDWTAEIEYPLTASDDLSRVAQFVALLSGAGVLKGRTANGAVSGSTTQMVLFEKYCNKAVLSLPGISRAQTIFERSMSALL